MANYELKPAQLEQLLEKLGPDYLAVSTAAGHGGITEMAPYVTAFIVKGRTDEEKEKTAKEVMRGNEKPRAVMQAYYNPFGQPRKPTFYVLLGEKLSSEIKDALAELRIRPMAEEKKEKQLARKPL